MTEAFNALIPKLPGPVVKANWLGRYLEVERKFDVELGKVLKDTERSVAQRLLEVERGEDISSRLRGVQLRLAQKTIRDYVNELFGNVGNLIKSYRKDAAEAAIDASLYDQRGLLAILFPNATDRQNYAESLRQTARRNIESVITRVLFTQHPLSTSVWKTKAISNGYISNAINGSLARGDSAADLAKSVRGLIRPETSGGVSYAARRLGRTEINNAFHAQAINDTQDTPWILQMQWNLSKRHKSDPRDLCESYALTRTFDKERVPKKPHPNCYCFVTPVLPDYNSFETELVQGHYDSYIDKVLAGATYRS